MQNFVGEHYRLANNWFPILDVETLACRPIKYLEIGTFFGANLLSVAASYGQHPNAELHCIDPWIDYQDYPEYQGRQASIYEAFLKNINNSEHKSKINIHRGFSHVEVPKFADEMFDVIYVDGNHEPEYVMEDAVLSFRKLKKGGYMIFDDYGWGGPDLTQRGIDGFLNGYHKKIRILGERNTQVFIQKL